MCCTISSWDGASPLLVLVLEVLGEVSVGACLVRGQTSFTFISLADLVDDPVATVPVVLCAGLGTSVPLDVTALRAAVCESVRSEVSVVDAETPSRRGRRHCDGLVRYWCGVCEAHFRC